MATGIIFLLLISVCCIPGGIAYARWERKHNSALKRKTASNGGAPKHGVGRRVAWQEELYNGEG